VGILAGLTVLSAWGVAYVSIRPWGPRLDGRPHEATGRVLAQQALALLQPGGQVAIIARDTSVFRNPASDRQLAGFRQALAKGGARIRATHALQVDPLRPVEVPPGDFLEIIRSTPKGDVIASFMGPPLLTPAQQRQLGEVKPAIIAFCSGRLPELVNLRALFDQGLLHAAVVEKPATPPASPRSGAPREASDSPFLAVTATNLAALPVPAEASPGLIP
jgi:hypothetical protein